MTHYSEEFRASIAARLLPPNNARIADITKETGVPKETLFARTSSFRLLKLPGNLVLIKSQD